MNQEQEPLTKRVKSQHYYDESVAEEDSSWTFDCDAIECDDLQLEDLFGYSEPWWDYEVDEHEGCDKELLYSDGSGGHQKPDTSKASSHFLGYNTTKGPVVRVKQNMTAPQLALADVMTSMSTFL